MDRLRLALAVAALVIVTAMLTSNRVEPSCETVLVQDVASVSHFGPLAIGRPVPHFVGISQSGREVTNAQPAARFSVYLIDARLPPVCLDDECGAGSSLVSRYGGRLVGSSDGKIAAAHGIKMASQRPWRLETSLAVVTDEDGVITSLHPGATLSDLPALVCRLGRGRIAGSTR